MTERAGGRVLRHRGTRARFLVLAMAIALGSAACTTGEESAALPTPEATATANITSTPRATPPTAVATAVPEPTIEDPAALGERKDVSCTFEIPIGLDPTCYLVSVPENWAAAAADPDDDDLRRVALEVAVFPAKADEGNTPIVYLEGGPGGHALSTLNALWSSFYAVLNETHDVVVWDQRGAGESVPALRCPGLADTFREEWSTANSYEDETANQLAAVTDCRQRLVGQGIDLSQYNSVSNATDLEAMRSLLGYDTWNVIGISYGTRLGQTAMRLYPEGIRAIVLDGIVPNAANPTAIFAGNAQNAFTTLFNGCAADAACAAAHPSFEEDFFDLVDEWNRDPVSFTAPDLTDPFSAPELSFEFTGDDLLVLTFGALYSPSQFVSLPDLVEDAQRNDLDLLSTLAAVEVFSQNFFTVGMFLSVSCVDELPFADPNAVRPADLDPRYDHFVRSFNGEFFFEVCAAWNVAPAPPAENELVISDIPTLLMGGGYDPITPASAADELAPGLSNFTSVVFPHQGHGASGSPCGLSLVLEFFAEPNLPVSDPCVDDESPPAWEPNANAPITMVPFDIDDNLLSVRAVRPAEWSDEGFGQFLRVDRISDPAFLLVSNSFDQPDDLLIATLQLQLDLPDSPERIEDITVSGTVDNDTTWRIWQYVDSDEETEGRIAVSDDLFVIVAGRDIDFPRFATEVLLPVLEAAEPR